MMLVNELRYRRLLFTIQPRRYVNLFRSIYQRRCRSLVEIGTWNGMHAEQMIRVAAARWGVGAVRYTGFDLFEDLTEEQFRQEYSKRPPSYQEVLARLEKTGARITLHRGNTRQTLPRASEALRRADLVFIDGGHSIETITADWDAVQRAMSPGTTVLFDDYYPDPSPELDGLGCQTIVDSLDQARYSVEVLQPTDEFPQPWGTLRVQIARVTLNQP
jgi:hypothetical protein